MRAGAWRSVKSTAAALRRGAYALACAAAARALPLKSAYKNVTLAAGVAGSVNVDSVTVCCVFRPLHGVGVCLSQQTPLSAFVT